MIMVGSKDFSWLITDANISINTDADTNMIQTDIDMIQTDTDMIQTDTDMIQTDTNISVSAKNIGQQIYWSISSSNF